MKNIVSVICLAVLLAVSLSAQGQGQPPAPPREPADQAAPRAQQPTPASPLAKVTISGCVQNAPPPAAPAAGAVPSAPAASKFDLANAKMVTPAAVGTSGTAATVTRYRLEGDEKIITPHLDHQVEITGVVSPVSGTGSTAAPMLKVESVKMVAAKCP